MFSNKQFFLTFILASSISADDCTALCTLIRGTCSDKGSYCKNGHTCMDVFWFVEREILCNHTSRDCSGKREVTCAEARDIVGSRNAQRIRNWFSFELKGAYIGSVIEMLLKRDIFRLALSAGADRNPGSEDLDIYHGLSGIAHSFNWITIRELTNAIERHPEADTRSGKMREVSSDRTIVKSLIASSSLIESIMSIRLGDGRVIHDFTAYTGYGYGSREFETSLVYNDRQPMRDLTVAFLPDLLLVKIREMSERTPGFTHIPFEFDFRTVSLVDTRVTGSTNYRLVGIVRCAHQFPGPRLFEFEYLDQASGDWFLSEPAGERRLPRNELPNVSAHESAHVLFERV